ncbi:MAG: right-handed parallel beta-helix repeat-containing protein [Deltaproteobacteria bacterium]|nr:right-handed parallel beta-helix repeat-containing protein [Deltaproteobacteria bacterium]
MAALLAAAAACASPKPGDERADTGGASDARAADAQAADGHAADAQAADVQAGDAQVPDAETQDAQANDASPADGPPTDAPSDDAAPTDGAPPGDGAAEDALALDAEAIDAAPDASAPDAEPIDTGLPLDCNGVPGGNARVDRCGVCDADPSNDCVQDCAGNWGGRATLDDCGVCDADPANDCRFTRYVDAVQGLDSNPGTRALPFRTVTRAVASISAGQSIKVWPGTYDAALGEVFPIRLPARANLWGDAPRRGSGVAPTSIDGAGTASGGSYQAALILSPNCHVAGFRFRPGSTVLAFGILGADAVVDIRRNTFEAGYGGINITGASAGIIIDNLFDTSSYGVYATGLTADPRIEGNQFVGGALPVDLSGAAPIVINNTIEGSGQVGIQIQGGAPRLEGNVFTHDGYTYGCFHIGGSPVIRGNRCRNGTTHGAYVRAGGRPDLGTAGDLGGNTFEGLGAPSIRHEGPDTVSAIGNTYPRNPPICGTDIVLTGSGVVIWGPAASAHCP